MTPPVRRPVTIQHLADLANLISALLAGMELDIFSHLKNGPMTADEAARAAGTHPPKTKALLEALASVGLVMLDRDRFSNSEESNYFLVKGGPEYIGMRHHAYRRRLMSSLNVADAIRTGKPQTLMDYHNMPAEARDDFYRGVHTEAIAAGRDFAARNDLSGMRKCIDVGGGSGGFSIALAQAWPSLDITVVDVASTKAVAERFIQEEKCSDRVRVSVADIVDGPIPGQYDVAVMRGVSLVLTLDQLRKTFANIYAALLSGSPLYVIGWILDDSRTSPQGYVAHNLRFATDYEAAELHTETEHRHLMEEVGFKNVRRDPIANVYGSDFMVGWK